MRYQFIEAHRKEYPRSFHLDGLKPVDGRNILRDKGLQGAEHDWEVLVRRYGGNPLALKLVAQMIREAFDGLITAFLKDGEVFFRDVRDVLEQQMQRLSAFEEEIIYWLAIEREATTFSQLCENIIHPVLKSELQEALRSLRRRHLIETQVTGFLLHPVILEYPTGRFVERVCEEIRAGQLLFFKHHALLLAQAKEYIRESQCRLILLPLLQRLFALFGKAVLERQFQGLLENLREREDQNPGYAAGNVLNLLIQLECSLRGYDFSHLVVRQAYLKGVDLSEVNFAHANLATSAFTDTFGGVLSVVFSPQGHLLAAGTTTGEIRFWDTMSGRPLQTFQGHTDWVRSVAFSPDGKILASGSHDQTIRLWEVSTGQLLSVLQSHRKGVRSVAFGPDEKTLASGGGDRVVRLWDLSTGQLLSVLQGHIYAVRSVIFSPDGRTLASGSDDQTVRLWDVSSGLPQYTARPQPLDLVSGF